MRFVPQQHPTSYTYFLTWQIVTIILQKPFIIRILFFCEQLLLLFFIYQSPSIKAVIVENRQLRQMQS